MSEQLWYPPQQPGFGPWIEGRPPQSLGRIRIQTLLPEERSDKFFTKTCGCCWYEVNASYCVAYCVPLEDKPTAAEVEATQKPPTPTLDAMEDELAENRPMFNADDVGVLTGQWARHNARAALSPATPAPPFMVGGVRSSDGLLTEWRGDHRLGGWQQ